jgi:hypothetical protein
MSFFISPPRPCRSPRQSFPAYRQSISIVTPPNGLFPGYFEDSLLDVPLGIPLVVLVAALLAFSAQSWINSLLGGEQGLGAFLSDGSGFNKSGFKQRRRPRNDYGVIPGDTTKPLGGPDPLPWLKLPELDFVDVAGQTKTPKKMQQSAREKISAIERNQSGVILRLDSLREKMKTEVGRGNFDAAKRIEIELERLMKDEGYDLSL